MLKGDVVPITDIPINTPVEIVDLVDKFKRYDEEKAPRLAIVTAKPYPNYYKPNELRVTLDGLFGERFKPIESVVPATSAPLKILTGTTKDKLLKLKYGSVDTAILANLENGYFGGTVGSDPEVFVVTDKGALIPAPDFLPDKKTADATRNGATNYGCHSIFWDGFQAEFTTYAAGCLAWQMDSVQAQLNQLLKLARAKFPGAKLSIQNVFDIPLETREKASNELIALGCAPSKNVYGKVSPIPKDGRQLPFRCAGGHMHFGVRLNPKQLEEAVKCLDAFVGVATVSLFESIDNPVRRTLYGLAGEYRTPAHGLEYRTPSNAWLCHPGIANLCFDFARLAIVFARNGMFNLLREYSEEKVQDIINGCDAQAARKFMDANKGAFHALLSGAYAAHYVYGGKAVDVAYETFYRGVDWAVKDPADIEGNWRLGKTWTTHCEGDNCQWRTFSATLARGEKA